MQRPVMDTRRIILFVIFSFSVLFLWQAWQQENAPPPPPKAATAAAPGATPSAAPPKDLPVPTAVPARAGRPAPPPRACRRRAARRSRRAAQKVTITTDLYTAEIDTVGGVITLVSLSKHRDATDTSKPYHALQRTAERTFVAQAGLHRRRAAQPPHAIRGAAGSARTRAAVPTASNSSSRRPPPNGDTVAQVLTFHRGSYLIDVAFDVTNATAAPDLALRVLPADARHQAGGRAELDGAGVLRRPGRLQRQGQFQEGRIRRDRQARGRSRRARARTRRPPTTAGSA